MARPSEPQTVCDCDKLRNGVGKVKALEVQILWLQQEVKAKTLILKTVKLVDNCADLEKKTRKGTVQYKLNAQSLRLFGLHSDVNDARGAGANRLQNTQTTVPTKRRRRGMTGTLNLLWSMNGLVRKRTLNKLSRMVGAATISSGELVISGQQRLSIEGST